MHYPLQILSEDPFAGGGADVMAQCLTGGDGVSHKW